MNHEVDRARFKEMRIEQICDAFENEHRVGKPGIARIHALLQTVDAPFRKQCLESLLRIDFEYRWKSNEIPSPKDYALHFPNDVRIVQDMLRWSRTRLRSTSCQQLAFRIDSSGLMSLQELESFMRELPSSQQPSSAMQLANQLIQASKLTDFQAQVLLGLEDFDLIRGDYVIVGKVGRGGMGDVYRALQSSMSRRSVAYKIIRHNHEDLRERFDREIIICAMLESDFIVPAYHTDKYRDTRFLATAYIEGGDFHRLVSKHGPMPGTAAVECLKQIAAGLEHAHSHGVIHRDLKPSNILWDSKRKRALLADWGIARCLSHAKMPDGRDVSEKVKRPLTNTSFGQFIGTHRFAPPEQQNPEAADQRSDIFALGKTLFCLVSGEPVPQDVDTILFGCGDYVDGLNEIYRDMTWKDRDDRFQSVSQLLVALRDIQPQSTRGLESIERWLASTPAKKVAVEHTIDGEVFSPHFPTDTFIKNAATLEQARHAARERIRTMLIDAECWMPPSVNASREAADPVASTLDMTPQEFGLASTLKKEDE